VSAAWRKHAQKFKKVIVFWIGKVLPCQQQQQWAMHNVMFTLLGVTLFGTFFHSYNNF
jgi:hypothetical protein